MAPGTARRHLIWKHNGLRGRARMAFLAMDAIASSPTVTDESHEIAVRAYALLGDLCKSLEKRDDAAINKLVGYVPKPPKS